MATDTLTPQASRGLPWGSAAVRDLLDDPYARGKAGGFTRAPSARQAMVQAGLDWGVSLGTMYVNHLTPDGVQRIEVPERYAVQRTDTGYAVGVVGERYEPLTPREQAEWTDVLVQAGASGIAGMGVTKDGGMGCRTYTVVEVGDGYRPAGMEDENLRVFLFTSNAFDGSTAFRASLAAWRMACINGLHINVRDLTSTWSIRHTSTMKERMELAQAAVRKAAGWGEALVVDAEELLAIPVAVDAGVEALQDLFPVPEPEYDDSGAQTNARAITNAVKRQELVTETWLTADDLANIRSTGYGLLQAVAEWNDWGRTYRSDPMDRLLARTGSVPILNRTRERVLEMA